MVRPPGRRFVLLLVRVVLVALAGVHLPPGDVPAEAQSAPSSTCVTCHTDGARLAALTPPDPPAAEAGEG